MFCAKRLLSENLSDGKYKVIKEGFIFDKIICYFSIENGVWLFTNQSGSHQISPVLSFESAIALTIEKGVYLHIAKTAISLWTVNDESDQKKIIDMCESLVTGNVISVDS